MQKPPKSSHSKRYIIIAAVVAIVVVALVLASFLFIRRRSSSHGAKQAVSTSQGAPQPTKPLSQKEYPAGEWTLRAKLKGSSWKALTVKVDESGGITLLASGVKVLSGELSKSASRGNETEYKVDHVKTLRPTFYFLGSPFDYLNDQELASSNMLIDVPQKGINGDWYFAILKRGYLWCEYDIKVEDGNKVNLGWSITDENDYDSDSEDDYDYEDSDDEESAYESVYNETSNEKYSIEEVDDQPSSKFQNNRSGTLKSVRSETPGQKAYAISMDDGWLFANRPDDKSDTQYVFEIPSNH